jgi:polar amino acid transport system substrate-binding protein
LISTARTEARKPFFKWIGPLSSGENCIFKLAERQEITVNTMSDLANYTIGTANDSAYNKILERLGFKEGKNMIVYPRKVGDLKPFAAGRVDFIVGSALSIESQLSYVDMTLTDVEPVFLIDRSLRSGNYLALNADTDAHIVNALTESYKTITENGLMERLESLYLSPLVKSTKNTLDNSSDSPLWQACVMQVNKFVN